MESRSLSHLFEKLVGIEYGTDESKQLFEHIVEHFCMHTKILDFHTKIAKIIDFSQNEYTASQFRLLLSESGYVILNLRCYATFLAGYRGLTPKVAEQFYEQYDICRCDAVRIYHAVKHHRTNINKYLQTQNQSYKRFAPEEFNEIRQGFAQYADPVHKYIRFITKKKLDFVYRFNNMDRRDFHSELMIAAIRAYYKKQPCDYGYDHMLNFIRSSVKKRALNIIDFYTTAKRQTLVAHGEGEDRKYILNVEAGSQVAPRYNSDGIEIPIEDRYDRDGAVTKTTCDFDLSADRMLSKLKNTRKGFVLAVYLGREVKKFSAWLYEHRFVRTEGKSCVDYIGEKPFAETAIAVAKYTDTSVEWVRARLEEVASELGCV